MKLAILKMATVAVLGFANTVDADTPWDDAMGRHSDMPPRYKATPMAEPSARNADVSEAPRCVPDSNGFFGDTSTNGVSLEYYYQVEYDTRVIQKVTDTILKTIQTKITDDLLPVLFERACSVTRRKLAESLRRRLEAVGISALPDDVIVEGASCSYDPSNGGASCALAFGQASIFAQEGTSAEHQGDKAIESIEIIMKDGGLNNIVPGILKVSYLNGTHVKGIDPSVHNPWAVKNEASGVSDDEGLPGYAVALIIVVVVGVVVTALFLIIRKRQQRARERRAMANPGALAFEELSLSGRSLAI